MQVKYKEQVEYTAKCEQEINQLLDQHEADNVEFTNMETHIATQDVALHETNIDRDAIKLQLTEVSAELESLKVERLNLLDLQETNAKLMDKVAFYQGENEGLQDTVAQLQANVMQSVEVPVAQTEDIMTRVADKLQGEGSDQFKGKLLAFLEANK